jgi:glycosyltransferase involved in cell wall biosynthesis
MTERLAVIVKWFPFSRRLSGLTTMAALLLERLAKAFDAHVLCECSPGRAAEWAAQAAYAMHPVPRRFWLRVGREAAKIQPGRVLVISGISRSALLYAALRPLLWQLGGRAPVLLYQGVNLDAPPGRMGRRLLKRLDAIVCAGPAATALLSQAAPGRCTCLPPGVDLAGIRSAPAAAKARPLRVGYFNHFKLAKGVDIALEAFAAMPFDDTEYVAAGTGPLEARMQARYAGHPNIRLLGHLPEPIGQIKACDFVVLPFRTAVSVLGISQTVLECLAAGVPVVGSRNDAITAAVRHEQEGLLFDTPAELRQCIRRLHDDAALRRRLAANAAKRAENYPINRVAETLTDLLNQAGS